LRSWRAFQRERIAFAEAAADVLINEFGVDAYREARRRKRDATTHDLTAHSSRVALAVARKIGKPGPVGPATPYLTLEAFALRDASARASSSLEEVSFNLGARVSPGRDPPFSTAVWGTSPAPPRSSRAYRREFIGR
jgi:hypothetical protein